ncbi:hypothetical protein ANN_09984, partial [Periplaneta americana]
KLFCKLCKISVSVNRAYNFLRHVNRDVHKRALMKLKEGEKCQQGHSSSSVLLEELCDAFLAANIPLHKLNNKTLCIFLEKHTGRSIPHPSTLRRTYIRKSYKCIYDIRNTLKDSKIWVSVDETTDTVGSHVVSVVIGAMDAKGPNGLYLLTCEIVDVVNYSSKFTFENAVKLLWPSGVESENVFVFVSDAAPYCIVLKNDAETDQEEEEELARSLAKYKLPSEGYTERNGGRKKSSEQKKISDALGQNTMND